MNLNRSSAAYDLSLFEKEVKKSNILELPKVRVLGRQRKLKKLSFKMKVVSLCTLFVAFLGFIIFSQIQLTEITDKIRLKKEELNEKKSICTQLELKRSAALSSDKIEQFAKNSGMQRTDPSQVELIKFHK